jgi:prepilin-type N-terminal cleavage/methylation domain-containing protein
VEKVRKGMTLVELLLVIAIIGTLIALLLPAVIRIRQESLLQSSLNNLRQITFATLNYSETNNNRLPYLVGRFSDPTDTVFVAMLPYLEQEPLYDFFHGKVYDVNNPVNMIVSSFLNPLDPTAVDVDMNHFRAGLAISSYACNAYVFTGKSSLASILDGTSNTILFSEHYQKCGPVVFNYLAAGTGSRLSKDFPGTRASFADGGPLVEDGANCGDYFPITQGNISVAADNVTFQVRPAIGDCDPRLPNATSARGLQVGMADGGVRILSAGLAPLVFWGAVTPASGEVISFD